MRKSAANTFFVMGSCLLSSTDICSEPSPDNLQSELNLSCRRCCPRQQARIRIERAARIEDLRICQCRRSKIRMIQYIENLHAELRIESFRDPFERVVLKKRKVQVGEPWSLQDVAAGIASQIETLREGTPAGVAVRCVEGGGWRSRYGEAFGLDVVLGIAGINRGIAAWTSQPVRKVIRVTAVQPERVAIGAKCRGERGAIRDPKNTSELPAVCGPGDWPGGTLASRQLPRGIYYEGPADIVVGDSAVHFQIEPLKAGDGIRQCVAGNHA